MIIHVMTIQMQQLALLTAVFLWNVFSEETSIAQRRVAQREVCVSFNPSSLLVDHMKSGYRVKGENTEIPITFANSNRADAFLAEGRGHTGLCWIESIEGDLRSGYDVYLIWQAPLPTYDTPIIPTLPNLRSSPSHYRFGATCENHSDYKYELDNKLGPAHLRDSDSTLLTFDSKDKAQRAYNDLSGGSLVPALCEISVTGEVDNKTHPVIAYRSD